MAGMNLGFDASRFGVTQGMAESAAGLPMPPSDPYLRGYESPAPRGQTFLAGGPNDPKSPMALTPGATPADAGLPWQSIAAMIAQLGATAASAYANSKRKPTRDQEIFAVVQGKPGSNAPINIPTAFDGYTGQ